MAVILVVEDDADTRRAIGEYLTALFPFVRVVMSESGESALDLALRTRPSVVLLDRTCAASAASSLPSNSAPRPPR